jgi:CRISPR-associated endonuclease Csn1
MEELRLWSVGNWKEVNGKNKNLGRLYPIQNEDYQRWLAFDPVYFGEKGISENGKPLRKNPYDLRFELLNTNESNEFIKKQKVGRAFYQMVQRRGFKSSRKSGNSAYAKNEDIEKLKTENSNFHIATLAKEKLDKGERFRASGVIQRKYFEDEFYAICEKQSLDKYLIESLHKAMYYVRPLRSQKGLVGNCTLEKGKARIPVSHPKFEEYRALAFINNIKWREKGNQTYEPIPISLKKKILEELFFRKLEKGTNKGKVNTDSYFKFDEIINRYSENGKYEFNYKNKPNVSTCPLIAELMNIFENEWQNKFIEEENSYGINWSGLKIEYTVKYGNKKGEKRTLGVDEIWHLLFDYIQTKDNQESLEIFCKEVLGFDEGKSKAFASTGVPHGYGSLSYSAISKILPFLQNGYIYSEAVSFANLKKVLGNKFEANKEEAKSIIANTIKEVEIQKEKFNIVNGLIQAYFSENYNNTRAKGVDNHIKEMAYQDTIDKLKKYFGEADWDKKSESERKKYEDEILTLYLKFLEGKQEKEEKASSRLGKNPEIDYYKLPRLDEAIQVKLKVKFGLDDTSLKKMYHPSDIDMYPKSKSDVKVRINGYEQIVKQLESPQPPSKGWKNPMAMRTLHELRHLINYLLRVGKIDTETKVVVEMARELNDANKRWAIQTYQRYREEENKEFAKAIFGVAKEKYPNLNENDIENINKVRLWWEQIENNEDVYKEIKALKDDVQKYRLWKEQECVCIYTGKTISLTDLFDGTQTQIMHTFPASKSFDNSLANLTVGDAFYNNEIQSDLIPSELPNYKEDKVINGKTYTAIEPRLKKWKEKVESIQSLVDERIKRAKRAIDPESKSKAIKEKNLYQIELNYWKKKILTFTAKQIPNTWKNSQLVDTQIISKYARAYLKTVFEKVDVQKGEVTSIFKEIYSIKGDEQKDRSKHSHHAIDAATLTLIPGSAKRESILTEYFKAKENWSKFHIKPYESFDSSHLLVIENKVLINHIVHDKTLTETFKHIKKRGKKTGRIAQGDSIRGRLHKETFFGAIKALERNEQGYPIKEKGKFKTITNPKTGENEIWIVARKPITEIKLDKGIIKDVIVDELLKQHLQTQINKGKDLTELTDFNNKPIRHIRMRVKAGVGYLSKEKAMPIKTQVYQSKHEHKRDVLTQNEENYLFLLYEGINEKGKTIRGYRILNLFDIARLKIKNIHQIKKEPEFQTLKKGKEELRLKVILKAGDKVIFYEKDKDEITKGNAHSRIFKIFKFNEPTTNTAYLYLQNIIEARPDNMLEKGEKAFNPDKYQARLELTTDKMNCLFEREDFEIKLDGEFVKYEYDKAR